MRKHLIIFLYNLYFLIVNVYFLINKLYFKSSKYLYNDINENKASLNNRKTIKIDCIDLYQNQCLCEKLAQHLGNKFIFKYNTTNPDYILYNSFGSSHLNIKYKNCVKISYYTENQLPDFNFPDYSIGFYHVKHLDKYFTIPWYLMIRINETLYKTIRDKVLISPKRTKFCAAVISDPLGNFRNLFIEELNRYKKVDMGGSFKNNVGGKVKNKISFLEDYKFSIAMENSEADGYTSEKIHESFISGTIPIYFGNYLVDEFYNPKSFILVKGEKDIKEKIEYIKRIDNNDDLYEEYLKTNILVDPSKTQIIYQRELAKFFSHIFSQKKLNAYRNYE